MEDFNSIKVRLELGAQFKEIWADYHFNSIKVRLEREIMEQIKAYEAFQFHKGAIRTR